MRVSQGGHDVPGEKLRERYPRTLANLVLAIKELPVVMVFDHDDLSRPYRKVAVYEKGRLVFKSAPLPRWLPGR
jgi:predicted ABC-type ATPase